jgi:uncharacterized membrane protein
VSAVYEHFHLPHFVHDHPPIPHLGDAQAARANWGERVSGLVAKTVGSWVFVLLQTLVLSAWIALNVLGFLRRWDPYPFILLNLVLSFQAAYTAPIIMMAQNREVAADRLRAELDYQVNVTAEEEVKALLARVEAETDAVLYLLKRMDEQQELLRRLLPDVDTVPPPGVSPMTGT